MVTTFGRVGVYCKKYHVLFVLFCVAFGTPGFAAVTANDDSDANVKGSVSTLIASKVYVDTHVKNSVSTLATKAELTAGLADKQVAGDYALKSDIPTVPTKASQLDNDLGYITSSALSEYAKTADLPVIPTNISAFANDAGYVKSSDMPTIPDTSIFVAKTGTNAMNGDYTVTGSFKVPTPALPTE